MTDSTWTHEVSPYHPGEEELHARLGRRDHQEAMGRRVHRPYMPDQHREFFSQLPFYIAGSVDSDGWPWASILFGKPGFVSTPDDRTITIKNNILEGDQIEYGIKAGSPVSFLGIEMPTRRRNRVNGIVRSNSDKELTVDVVQSFGNCPQYIHTREMQFTSDPNVPQSFKTEQFTKIDGVVQNIIHNADTFFVASNNNRDDKFTNGGVDVNHRGGKPGFVKIDGNILTIPDFIGNFAFNTLGNFIVNPKAGLLFIDFATGDLIQLTGTVELLWEPMQEIEAFQGAERAWRFTLDHGHRLIAAAPMRWEDGDISPNTALTGNWRQAEEIIEATNLRTEWKEFQVIRIEDESSVIRSFYLEPTDGKSIPPYKPGQYLTLQVHPKDQEQSFIRTYTLSASSNNSSYRISVKREDLQEGKPKGKVSTYLHSDLKVNDKIEVRGPNGNFWLNTEIKRPAVLLAGGVGITPMIAMAQQAVIDGFARRNLRPLTILHSTNTTQERAFAKEFMRLQQQTNGAIRYFSVIDNPSLDEKAGKEFHEVGPITSQLLQNVLPLADYDFYLCGPPPFMQAIYDMLIELGIRDARISAEAFGPASLNRQRDKVAEFETFEEPKEAFVDFIFSGKKQLWKTENGTLLEFSEAQGLTPIFGCRTGACGSCAVRIKKGAVHYRTQPKFPLQEGEALICCSVPAKADEDLVLEI